MKAKPMGMLWMMPPGWLNRLRDSLAGSSKLLTWCHWLDRNIARVGVAADLEVVKRAGLGGVYLFDCDIGMPQGPVCFRRYPWLVLTDHTIQEAQP